MCQSQEPRTSQLVKARAADGSSSTSSLPQGIWENMGLNQTPSFKKRFYHVKTKSLKVASLQELGQQMDQVQRQAFHKTYGKIWDLAMIEVSVEAITSITHYYDQPLRCFTFGDFQLVPIVEEFEGILGCPLGGRKSYFLLTFQYILNIRIHIYKFHQHVCVN